MMIGKAVFAALLSACATPTNALTARNDRQAARKVIVVGSSWARSQYDRAKQARMNDPIARRQRQAGHES
jgi:hypothetical protein